MMIKRENYYNDETWTQFINISNDLPTPHVLINLDTIRRKYAEVVTHFSNAKVYYAVKACPAMEVIEVLKDCGANFDIASIYELDRVLAAGVTADRLSFGNTIKKASDIEYAYQKGIRIFATDCLADIDNIAQYAPKSKIYVRILVDGGGTADWPLSRKFGCHPEKAVILFKHAQEAGLEAYGVSFHVGSQQRDVDQWHEAITKTKYLFDAVAKAGIQLKMINMGGGFPASYVEKTSALAIYAQHINQYLLDIFGLDQPLVMLEPGRSITADAGILVSEVIMVSCKSYTDPHRWVYIDAGKFNGLIETLDEITKFPIVMAKSSRESEWGDVILAGPTCDSYDVLYEKYKYQLPLDVSAGERLYWLTAGAYTLSYASVEFNGFPPIKAYFFEGKE